MTTRKLFPDGTVITFGRKLSKAEKKRVKKQRQLAARTPVLNNVHLPDGSIDPSKVIMVPAQ